MQRAELTHSAARWLDPAIGFAVSVALLDDLIDIYLTAARMGSCIGLFRLSPTHLCMPCRTIST
jgi:hypothetical protein